MRRKLLRRKTRGKRWTVATVSDVKFYKDETYDLAVPCFEKVVSQEITKAPDNRVTERVVQKISMLGKAASPVIQDMLDAGITSYLRAFPNASVAEAAEYNAQQAVRNSLLKVDSFTVEKMTYEKIKQKVPPGVDVSPDDLYKYRLRKKAVYEFVSRAVYLLKNAGAQSRTLCAAAGAGNSRH